MQSYTGWARNAARKTGDTARDYVKRIWDNSGEDNIFFLASAVSFSILLAVVPFFLFYATSLTYLLNESTAAATIEVSALMDRFLPPRADGTESLVTQIVADIIRSRGKVGLYSAIGFIWFSTRLFGTLRSVLGAIFDLETDRGIVDGKLFDIKVTVISTLMLVAYTTLSAYLALSTGGTTVMKVLGLRQETMSLLNYIIGRVVAFAFIAGLFYGLYKYLPYKRIRWQTALVASIFAGIAFEVAKSIFAFYATSFRPGSLYTGTVAALVVTISWVYYAAVVFILGGEVGQVYELRWMRKIQREAFED